MATRRHAPSEGVNWTLVIVPLLVVALGAGAFLLLKKDGKPAQGPKAPPRVAFAFADVNTRFYRTGKAPQGDAFEVAAGNVNGLMNIYYDNAFVNPDAWKGGAFPEALAAFAPSAGEQASQDLGVLTLGPESARVQSVTPGPGTLQVTVLLDRDGLPVAQVAYAEFDATGDLKAGGQLAIAHRARYFFRLVDGAWKITGYDVDTSLDSGVGSPTPEETTTP